MNPTEGLNPTETFSGNKTFSGIQLNGIQPRYEPIPDTIIHAAPIPEQRDSTVYCDVVRDVDGDVEATPRLFHFGTRCYRSELSHFFFLWVTCQRGKKICCQHKIFVSLKTQHTIPSCLS